MLMLPDDFALATTLSVQSTAPGWWFVVAGDQVLVRVTRTGVELPMAPEWPFVDWPIVRQIDLGVLRGRPCYAVEAAKQDVYKRQRLDTCCYLQLRVLRLSYLN